jgi:hypothetical protein
MYNGKVNKYFSDTDPKIVAMQMDLLRKASPVQKMALLGQLNQMVKELALSGLRSRYPNDSPAMIQRRLADLLLGPELALKVYGKIESEEQDAP